MNRHTTVTRRGHVAATADDLIAALASTEGFTRINPHLTDDPDLVIIPTGPAAGVGSGFAFRGKNGKGTQTVAKVTTTEVVHDIDMGAVGRSRQRITATPSEAGGCEVEWSMTLDAGRNPLLRIFGLVAEKVLSPTLETGLRNLAAAEWPAHAATSTP